MTDTIDTLLIENDEDMADSMKLALSIYNFHLHIARTLQEALIEINSNSYHLVILILVWHHLVEANVI